MLKRTQLTFAIALAATTIIPAQDARAHAAPVDTTIVRETLAEGIYLFRAPSDLEQWTATNTVVIVNEQDVTVFDSNTRASTARKIIAQIRAITNKPVRILINSHWHQDHWSGNDEYRKAFPGLQIIATTETRDYMKRMTSPFFATPLANSLARGRASLDSAIRSGKQTDGSPLTPEARKSREDELATSQKFYDDVRSVPRVLPNMVYRDSLIFWSGSREFRLVSGTGDATGSTILYLPAERMLVMGDVLVAQEDGKGAPPWTTNGFSITPWYNTLRRMQALNASIIVPGQGLAFRDDKYLVTTADMFESILKQVHAAMERGIVTTDAILPLVNLDDIAKRYFPDGAPVSPNFRSMYGNLVRKAVQESFDGVTR